MKYRLTDINVLFVTGKTFGPDHIKDIWYSYKEGYSNAVRKTITIGYLK